MNLMFIAPANQEVRPVEVRNQPPPAKEKPVGNFKNILQKTKPQNAESSSMKKPDNSKAESLPVLAAINAALTDYQEQSAIPSELMLNPELILQQLNSLLEANGSTEIEDLDYNTITALVTNLLEGANPNPELNEVKNVTDNKEAAKTVVLSELLLAKSDHSNQIQLVNANENPEATGKVNKENINANVLSDLAKTETKNKNSEVQHKIEEAKVLVKNETTGNADVKRIMILEANRFNGVKMPIANGDNSLAAGLTTDAGNETEEAGTSLSFNKLDTLVAKAESPTITMPNNKPIEAKEIIDQIVKKAEIMLKQNASEIKIDLKPEFLGKMTIKIAIEEGMLTARFLIDNHQVRNLLESNLHTLRQSLEAQGIKVEKTEVNVQLNNGGLFDGSENGKESEWARPDYSGTYQPKELERDFIEVVPDFSSPNDDTLVSAYQAYENGSLSFLI